MERYCTGCARKLKEKKVPKGGKVITITVCPSPVCKKYGVAQEGVRG